MSGSRVGAKKEALTVFHFYEDGIIFGIIQHTIPLAPYAFIRSETPNSRPSLPILMLNRRQISFRFH